MRLDDPNDVMEAFVLVMAWGSGIIGSRGLRNTRLALDGGSATVDCLATSARMLRDADEPGAQPLLDLYKGWRVPGVGQAFLAKWFAFAGRPVDRRRSWNPLILDSRVYRSLGRTLDVDTRVLAAGSRLRARRYWAYVSAMHDWASQLSRPGREITAERLEWVLFSNGAG